MAAGMLNPVAVLLTVADSPEERALLSPTLVGQVGYAWWDLYGWCRGVVVSYRQCDGTFLLKHDDGHFYRARAPGAACPPFFLSRAARDVTPPS
jgi:hypothetical protein